ncbi:MAG TPA: hypothetical protein VFG83_15360 [Kofleriaceae bacterium]|nr:hypothetical protein [Kofleriaceae bacterium]
MARIRIVDEWLPNPMAMALRTRTVMVVADSWSEQRVLMRAYASCADQTRPTIVLHGNELAIGPAGTDPHGAWGIHVAPLTDGRAQVLRDALDLAARRLAGSRGHAPRLVDEMSTFETKATNHWAPGVPADVPAGREARPDLPAREARPDLPAREARPGLPPREPARTLLTTPLPRPSAIRVTRVGVIRGAAAVSPRRRRRITNQLSGQRAAIPRNTPAGPHIAVSPPHPPALAVVVTRTMPHGFQLTDVERNVLNALGREKLMSAREIAHIAGAADGIAWMEALMIKLAEHGLDIIALGPDRGGEPTYELRR